MPRRGSNEDAESPVPRRTSARIAAAQQNRPSSASPSSIKTPKRTTSKRAKKSFSKSMEEPSTDKKEDLNGMESNPDVQGENTSFHSCEDAEEPPIKKSREEHDKPSENEESGLGIIEDSAVHSDLEIKDVISIQADDEQLLVDFVQIPKVSDEVEPAVALKDISTVNGDGLCCSAGDVQTSDTVLKTDDATCDSITNEQSDHQDVEAAH